ncbi:MAG: Crp/Fnr family transcriptional regulator [Acidobacteria bacterium]|nr:Crp/Fnr family transcriptional regulator [Acidobacteriota bacterium]
MKSSSAFSGWEAAITLSSCRLYSITAPAFLDLMRTDQETAKQILLSLSRRNCARDICSAQSSSVLLDLRFQQLIWQLLQAQNRESAMPNGMQRERKLLVPVQNQNLAQMLGVSPEHFSRMLGKMEKEDVLRRCKGPLIFPDPERLWRAPEIENLVKSNRGQNGQFTLADPIYA